MFLSIDLIGHETIGLWPKGPGAWAAGAIVALQLATAKPAPFQSATKPPGRRYASVVPSTGGVVPDGEPGHAPPSTSRSPSPPKPQDPTIQSK